MTLARIRVVVLLAVWAAPSLWAQTPLCTHYASLDPANEREATPRDSENAEVLALTESYGVAADTPLYEVIRGDLERILLVRPDLEELRFRHEYSPRSLTPWFVDHATREVARYGGNPDFDCLNELFEQDWALWYEHTLPDAVHLRFDGRYRMGTVREAYAQVPGVELVYLHHYFYPEGIIGCFYRGAQQRRVYFFEEWRNWFPSVFPVRLVRAEVRGADLLFTETVLPTSPLWKRNTKSARKGSSRFSPLSRYRPSRAASFHSSQRSWPSLL